MAAYDGLVNTTFRKLCRTLHPIWFVLALGAPSYQRQIVVFTDGKQVGRMKLTDEVAFEVLPGAHTFF